MIFNWVFDQIEEARDALQHSDWAIRMDLELGIEVDEQDLPPEYTGQTVSIQSQREGMPAHSVDECVICMHVIKEWLCVPCGHLAMCGPCIAKVKRQTGRCPICRRRITQVVRVYRA